ncbi:hypothetical protein [Pseudomonas sp. MWU13-2100]|uniref:hypothetical protein n=1 Tax=Pseudomonas sp. MWU13-2100 TaxID=2935075 RepID=UPI00200F2A54|nr:hypothetical protein [Pseudomonas sp. MWU13-2100]
MLTFDYSLNQYEISGAGLSKENLGYLDAIIKLLKSYAIVVPGIHLAGRLIRATQGGSTYTLGEIHTQGREQDRVIYPGFRDQWSFDFAKDISSFLLWKEMSDALRASYSELQSDLLKRKGAGARALISLALLEEFVALADVQGAHIIQKRQELSFLKGLIALYYLGLVQKKVRVSLGVDLPDTGAWSVARVRRAAKKSLTLLIGEDIASVKLYRALATYEEPVSMDLIGLYFSYKSKGGLKHSADLTRFSIALKAMIAADVSSYRWRLDTALYPFIADLVDPHSVGAGDPETVQRYLENLDKDFVRFRKDNLDRRITRDQGFGVYTISHYHRVQSPEVNALWGRARPKFIDLLPIDYISPGAGEIPFDGTIHVVAHADIFGLSGVSNPERIASWIYSNFSRTFGRAPARFKELKCINFTACHFPKAMAEYVAVLFLQQCLEDGRFKVVGGDGVERNWVPNITVVCSPHTALAYNSGLDLIPFAVVDAVHTIAPFPGVVLNIMSAMRAREFTGFLSRAGGLDFNEAYVQEFLKETRVFSIDSLVGEAFQGGMVSEEALDEATKQRTVDYKVYEQGLREEKKRRRVEASAILEIPSPPFGPLDREQHVAATERLFYESASIKPEGATAFLRVNTFETMRLLHEYYAAVKNRYRALAPSRTSDDAAELNSQIYKQALDDLKRENRIKFLLDPLDPRYHYKRQSILKGFRAHLGVVYREFRDFPFYSPHQPPVFDVQPDNYAWVSYYNQQLAEILFVATKQEYREMTGIEVDKIHLFSEVSVPEDTFSKVQKPKHDWTGLRVILGAPLYRGLLGCEQLGVSTWELRALLDGGKEARILPALGELENNLKSKRGILNDSQSLKRLQETQDNLNRAKTSIQKKTLSSLVLKTSARIATGSSRLLGAFGVFADFRTQPFHLDFSSARSGVFTVSDSLAVVKGVFDFTTDIGPLLALRLASSATRALWRPRLDQLFFKMNKVLLPLDVLFTAVSLHRNVEGTQLAKSAEEQALYITMTVIDAAAFGVNLAAFVLIGVPGVNVVLILVGAALAIVNIILNSIVSLSQLDNYRWNEKVGLFFGNMFGSAALEGILTQQQMRGVADLLFDGSDPATGLHQDGIDLFLTPMINDADDHDQTNPLKDIGTVNQDAGFRREPRGYTLSPSGFGPNDLRTWADAKGRGKAGQVYKGWYLRRREARRGRERKLLVTMPSTPNTRLEVLDFGPIPTILLFGATPHLLLNVNPFGWAAGESPEEQARNKYQVRLYPETSYTLQFKSGVMASNDLDSNFGGRTELIVPGGEFQALPQVSLDLSGQEDARASIPELDLSRSSLEVVKFKDKSTFKLGLVSTDGHTPCALEQVVRTVQLPAHIQFKSGEQHPVMAVVGQGSRITLKNSKGRSLLLLRREVVRCEIDIQASVGGFAVSI